MKWMEDSSTHSEVSALFRHPAVVLRYCCLLYIQRGLFAYKVPSGEPGSQALPALTYSDQVTARNSFCVLSERSELISSSYDLHVGLCMYVSGCSYIPHVRDTCLQCSAAHLHVGFWYRISLSHSSCAIIYCVYLSLGPDAGFENPRFLPPWNSLTHLHRSVLDCCKL